MSSLAFLVPIGYNYSKPKKGGDLVNLVSCTLSKDRQQYLLGPTAWESTPEEALLLLRGDLYWGYNLARVEPAKLVTEEIGRNTGNVWSRTYSGSPEEMRLLLKFAYFYLALGAACFCVMGPEWRTKAIEETAKKLAAFPQEVRLPLPVACICVASEEFAELKQALSATIGLSPNPQLVEQGPDPKWPWRFYDHRMELTLLLTLGINTKEDIEAAFGFAKTRADACTFKTGEPSIYEIVGGTFKELLASWGLQREGVCSFREALALAS